ncbi:flagellar export protein FliJ [Virgibacillus oceani]
MAETKSFVKILHVREREEMNAQKAYQQSIDIFEQIATSFYHLLRKKEKAEMSYDELIQHATTLDKVKEQAAYIEKLNKQIVQLQSEVQQARNEMESNQSKLTDAHVEVKKFQNIIESRNNSEIEKEKKLERNLMDEVSLQQYISYKNR